MGNKFCNNCENICEGKNKITEANLSINKNISNENEQDELYLNILSTNKIDVENIEKNNQSYEINKRIEEITKLNKIRKIIKAYKLHLKKPNFNIVNNKKSRNIKEKKFNYFNRKLVEMNTELNSRSSRDKKSNNEENKKFFNDNLTINSNEKEFIKYNNDNNQINYSNIIIPKINYQNLNNSISYEKEDSTLSVSNRENNIKRKSVSFMNPVETNVFQIENSKKNLKKKESKKYFNKVKLIKRNINIQLNNESFDSNVNNK